MKFLAFPGFATSPLEPLIVGGALGAMVGAAVGAIGGAIEAWPKIPKRTSVILLGAIIILMSLVALGFIFCWL
jgi:hypothetical protein